MAYHNREAWAERGRSDHNGHLTSHLSRKLEHKTNRYHQLTGHKERHLREVAERAAVDAEAKGAILRSNQRKVENVRQQVSSEVIQSSRRYFYDQRREQAQEKRASSREWKSDRRLANEKFLAKAFRRAI